MVIIGPKLRDRQFHQSDKSIAVSLYNYGARVRSGISKGFTGLSDGKHPSSNSQCLQSPGLLGTTEFVDGVRAHDSVLVSCRDERPATVRRPFQSECLLPR